MKRNKLLVTALVVSSFICCCNEKANATSSVIVDYGSTETLDNKTYENITGSDYGQVVLNNGTLNVLSSTLKSNTTSNIGGTIENYGSAVITGSVFTSNSAYEGGAIDNYKYNSVGSVQISGSSFTSNNSSSNGGAISNYYGTVTVSDNSTFTSNTATYSGGAIYSYEGILDIDSVTFDTNTSSQNGGAIGYEDASGSGTSSITNSTFTSNSATTCGGAIWILGGAIDISDSSFEKNHSSQGGAIASMINKYAPYVAATVNITNSEFLSNYAETAGAIANFRTMNITDSTFTSNYSTSTTEDEGGGALFLGADSETYISGSTFTSNISAENGGAISTRIGTNADNSDAKLDIIDSTFTDNKATGYGGAIFNTFYGSTSNSDYVTISGSTFTDNSATEGGGIYNSGTQDKGSEYAGIYIDGSTFTSNEATGTSTGDGGGAIYNGTYTTSVITNSEFTSNSTADYGYGGAIKNDFNADSTISNTTFTSNTAWMGGAIFDRAGGTTTITDSTFDSNNATSSDGESASGGAIYIAVDQKAEGSVDIYSSVFSNNTADSGAGAIGNFGVLNLYDSTFTSNISTYSGTDSDTGGGAIFLGSYSQTSIDNTTFDGNTSGSYGGAITTRTTTPDNSNATLDITNSTFTNNTATVAGGAIYNTFYNNAADEGYVTISGSTFTSNSAADGGAVYNAVASTSGENGKISVESSTFTSNTATSGSGGAIYNSADTESVIEDSTFTSNTASTYGGAVYNDGTMEITGSSYTSNSSGSDGGAIYSTASSDELTISSSSFTNNSSNGNGGAIATLIDSTITDTSFTGNTASGSGGAIYTTADLTIVAENSDVTFSSNSASSGSDIYMSNSSSTLTLNSNDGTTMTFESGISGTSGYTVKVNTDSTDTGTVVLNSTIENAAITTSYGTLHLAQTGALVNSTLTMEANTTLNTINNQVETFGSELTLGSNVNLLVDVDLGSGTADNYANANVTSAVISEINSIGTTATANNITINLYEATGLSSSQLTLPGNIEVSNALTPIRWLQGSVDSTTGILSYSPTGNSYNDFNPAVMASPVAAQLGGYLTQLNSYDEAFRNMDMYMLMTKKERQALKNANKYAAADSSLAFSPLSTPYTDKAGWVRPYATFESVGLKNGPKVSNVAYGMYGGLESEMYDLGNGWDGIYSIYAGYNGSHQAYQGNSIYQNGGTLGIVGMAYKDNFFTGLTVNVGANAGQANTMYGNEDFTMLMTGVASKSGYNYELADGKFIVQPNFLMSYSMVNTFDYTNAAGVRIDSDPLHAIQLEPGLKFIGNLQNGWQPYAGVSVVWNIMDKTEFKANDVSLPDLSIKPYVKYGVGIRKTWGKRFVGYLQAFLTNGGRNGVGLQTGFRWTIGKDPSKYTNSTGEKKYIKAKA